MKVGRFHTHPPPPPPAVPHPCSPRASSCRLRLFFAQVPFFLLPAIGGVGVFVAVWVLSHKYDVSRRGSFRALVFGRGVVRLRGLWGIFFGDPSRDFFSDICFKTHLRVVLCWWWSWWWCCLASLGFVGSLSALPFPQRNAAEEERGAERERGRDMELGRQDWQIDKEE